MPQRTRTPTPCPTTLPGAETLPGGALIDVTEAAERLGFTVRVAVTDALWMRHVHVETATERHDVEQARRL